MTAPNHGPCVCDDDARIDELRAGRVYNPADYRTHEHAEFEPYACADCDCEGFRPAGSGAEPAQNRHHSHGDERTGPRRGIRPPLTIPDQLDFATERVQDTAAWIDRTITQIRGTFTDPDDPLAVCHLADHFDQNAPEGIDPLEALALTIRRLIDATNHGSRATPRQRAINAIRRKIHP